MYAFSRPLLFWLDPERAHGLGLAGLQAAHRCGLSSLLATPPKPLPTKAFGLTFPNPVGLAAGLDKDGAHIDALMALGFGFIEIGTVTPKPQPGNERPRLFRLERERAIINRMGFNSGGVETLVRNVERAKRRGDALLGINIGRNKNTPNKEAAGDYVHCLRHVYPLADYVAVNISSPNTAGLRELQEEQALRQLVGTLRDEQERLAGIHGKRVPVLVFCAEDYQIVSWYGDRTLSRYRAIAQRQLGPSCPLPGAPVDKSELAATLQDWLDEFERVHLLLRLSGRLRQKYND